jgi:hypothetical protein
LIFKEIEENFILWQLALFALRTILIGELKLPSMGRLWGYT